MQLQKFLYLPRVCEALERRIRIEEDDECRQYLQHLLWLANARSGRLIASVRRQTSAPPGPVTRDASLDLPGSKPHAHEAKPVVQEERPAAVDKKALTERFLTATEAELPNIMEVLEGTPDPERGEIAHVLLWKPDLSVSKILSLLELTEKSFVPAMEPQVSKFLFHQNLLVVGKALQLASKRTPATLVRNLPELLEHAPVPIRVMAIRFLYCVSPEESLRLLGEFLDNPNEEQRRLGLELAFTFPFEAIRGVLVRIIEGNRIQGSLFDLVKSLVKSNPDREFLAAVADLRVRTGDRIPGLGEILDFSAESLSLSGVDPRPPGEIVAEALRAAEEGRSKPRQEIQCPPRTPAPSPLQPGTAVPTAKSVLSLVPRAVGPGGSGGPGQERPAVPSPPEVKKETPAGGKPPGLAPATAPKEPPTPGALEALSPDEFRSRLAGMRKEGEILHGIQEIRRRKLRDKDTLKWLEKGIGPAPDKVRVSSMELLYELSPKALQPHLPVLCCHESDLVACQAIRILRRIEGNAFLKRIQNWVQDPSPSTWAAALRGLMQFDFDQTRMLVIDVLERWPDSDTLKHFSPVLRMNPDPTTIFELDRLRKGAPALRVEAIDSLIRGIEQNLAEISSEKGEASWPGVLSKETLNLGGALDDLMGKIRKINYRVGKGGIQGLIGDTDQLKTMAIEFLGGPEKAWKIVGGIMSGIVLLVFVVWLMSPKAPPPPIGTVVAPPGMASVPQEKMANIVAVVVEVDVANNALKLLNAREETFRVIEVDEPKQFKVGDRIEVTVKSSANSFVGKVVIPESIKKLR